MQNFNFCKNKMGLDKVTCYIQPFSVSFFKLFTTVATVGTLNYKISLDKIVDIFPNKNIYV